MRPRKSGEDTFFYEIIVILLFEYVMIVTIVIDYTLR